AEGVAGVPRMPVDGQPPGRVPIVPGSATLIGWLLKSSAPLLSMVPRAIECMSPLTTSGTRPFIAESAAIRRSCCLSQPDCQNGLGIAVVSLRSGPRMSGYHSPHLPAVQPGGLEGACTRCETSVAAVLALSHFSASGST